MRQQERIFSNELFTPTFVFFSQRRVLFLFLFLFLFFHYREERVRKREREREREREFFFSFVFFCLRTTTFLACCRLDDVGAFVAFLPRLFFTSLSLSLSLSRRKSDIIKQKGPNKKKKRDQREMLFFFRLSFFQQQKSTKRERGLFEPFVLSNENEGLIIINRQKHRAPLKPLEEEEEEDSEDEDGTQTLLETVRVLHRALQ